MTNAERNAEMEIRSQGLKALDRKNLVANFEAYWPSHATKGVHRHHLEVAIMRAEFESDAKLVPVAGQKATETWGR